MKYAELGAKWLASILSIRWGWVWLGLIWGLGVAMGNLHPLAVALLLLAWFVYASLVALVARGEAGVELANALALHRRPRPPRAQDRPTLHLAAALLDRIFVLAQRLALLAFELADLVRWYSKWAPRLGHACAEQGSGRRGFKPADRNAYCTA